MPGTGDNAVNYTKLLTLAHIKRGIKAMHGKGTLLREKLCKVANFNIHKAGDQGNAWKGLFAKGILATVRNGKPS